ncbi:MAG: Phenylalanine--tRNA ligase beta subunit [Anaerolineales bacterium]|nr:Phenylalanine--tRNA ligase beta subunit [Anaerolineales bacterium]
MKLPLSWLKDYLDITGLSPEDIARKLTFGGLEVEEIKYAGWTMPAYGKDDRREFKTEGIAWDRERIVVAEIREVKPHPNADRLTLCDLFDGTQEQVVLTGAPNIFHLKGTGKLPKPIKVAYAKEGATIYDGHADGLVLTTLKRAKIRGVESYSMVCSEKELGISEEHEGIILLDEDAPVGTPLADYMGDAVLEVKINPNMARCASVLGIARELAALLGRELRDKSTHVYTYTGTQGDFATLEITDPTLNPRFVLGLIRDVEIKQSPYWVQRRLKMVGARPINNIVDATNYAMFELGEPLHAFDYDVLVGRVTNSTHKPKILTRAAKDGEKLTTLDGVERTLTPMNVLVCDEKGALSLAGVMGGAESEVTDKTKNILLEGAAWNFINVRRTARQHNLQSEASFRFSRGVHPAMADKGVSLGLKLISEWSGGTVAPGLVDSYPLPPKDPTVEVTPRDVKRVLGIDLTAQQIIALLERVEFKCEIQEPILDTRKPILDIRYSNNESSNIESSNIASPNIESSNIASPNIESSNIASPNIESSNIASSNPESRISVTTPPYRLDIGEGVVGLADILEEIARLYGIENIPATNIADALPPQIGNPIHEWEERLRDLLISLGFIEIVSYRMTSVEKESRLARFDDHVVIANPITPERNVLRRSLLASVLEAAEKNARAESLSLFEIGAVFLPHKNELPDEPRKLAIVMTGRRAATAWDVKDSPVLDFFDMKGRIELLLAGLQLADVSYAPADSAAHLHPGKAAEIKVGDKMIGQFGELHPLVKERYELGASPVLAAEFDLAALTSAQSGFSLAPVPEFPPVYEDIAVIVDESVAAARVESLIRQTGGRSVTDARLFDVYRDEKIGAGKKSLAYALTYQSPEKTLTDAEAAAIRNKIVKRLEQEVKAKLRS